MQRLLIFWLALSLLVGPAVPAGLLLGSPSPATVAESGSAKVMHASNAVDTAMVMSAPCEACDPASSGHGNCASGACEHKGCAHASCSLFLPRPSLSSRGGIRSIPAVAVIGTLYRSHLPDLPKRPPIA